MKAEKGYLGARAEVGATKGRERRIVTAILLIFTLSMVMLSAYFAYTILNPLVGQSFVEPIKPTVQFRPENSNSQLEAAIVDQVGLTIPDQTFIETATNTLEQAGYKVAYYPGEDVTVEFYRDLLTDGYNVVILRVHSTWFPYPQLDGSWGNTGKQYLLCPITLFTSQPYSKSDYINEQLSYSVVEVAGSIEEYVNGKIYFGISPSFVESSAKGNLSNALVIAMGCESLWDTTMAEAFIQKGAKVYIGWTEQVSASYTDQATATLLQHLVTENQTIRQAVENTMKEVGPDPASNSQLTYYPAEAGEQTTENIGKG